MFIFSQFRQLSSGINVDCRLVAAAMMTALLYRLQPVEVVVVVPEM
jgi:hypothetical protein